MKKAQLYSLALALGLSAFSVSAKAQSYADSRESKWYFGIGGGLHVGTMTISELDEDIFPETKGLNSGLFSVFVERNFGKRGIFGIRPELTWLKRGGSLTEIYSEREYEDISYYESEGIEDIRYSLTAHYLDLRIPLFLQFGNYASRVRPYVYAGPVVGIPVGGCISVEQRNLSGHYSGYGLALNKGNIASTYISGIVGAGLKWNLNVDGKNVYVGVDAGYKLGLADTYSAKEKNGEAITKDMFYNAYEIKGERKFGGFELKATIGIPLGKKKVQPVVVTPVPVPVPVVVDTVKEEPVVEEPVQEKPCYSLEEINDMISNGENVYGKTFCAIDAIQFEFGKSTIKSSSFAYLDELTAILVETGMKVEVKGHTDNVGTEEYNLKLSRERAEAVVNYLVKKGVDKTHLSYSYYGMSVPLVSNDTEDGRRMNRRVEFEILK